MERMPQSAILFCLMPDAAGCRQISREISSRRDFARFFGNFARPARAISDRRRLIVQRARRCLINLRPTETPPTVLLAASSTPNETFWIRKEPKVKKSKVYRYSSSQCNSATPLREPTCHRPIGRSVARSYKKRKQSRPFTLFP